MSLKNINKKKTSTKSATSTARHSSQVPIEDSASPAMNINDVSNASPSLTGREQPTLRQQNLPSSSPKPLQASVSSSVIPSSPIKDSAKSQNLPSSSHTSVQASVVPSSPQTQHMIAYVHNLSPIKRNKRNTVDYSSFTLQTQEGTQTPALCYSKSKRKILEEKEESRSPIKIARFTKTNDGTKIVVNEKTVITDPSEIEYAFQFYQDSEKQPSTIADIIANELDEITVHAKVVKIPPPKALPSNYNKDNKVCQVIIIDNTGVIPIDLWNDQIQQVKENEVFKFSKVSSTYWNGKKKLTGTFDTIIRPIERPDLQGLTCSSEEIDDEDRETACNVMRFNTVEEVKTYKTCLNCNKKILQLQSKFVDCDYCHHSMLTAACPTRVYANVVLQHEGKKLTLTVFDDCLKKLFGPTQDESLLKCSLLELTDIVLKYNTKNVVTELTGKVQ